MTADETNKAEGVRIRAMREGTGLSRNLFASRLGISALTLKNVENGMQRLGVRTLHDAERLAATDASERERFDHGHQGKVGSCMALTLGAGGEIGEEALAKALRAAEDPAVQTAAEAFAEAAGISHAEALAAVITRKLRA